MYPMMSPYGPGMADNFGQDAYGRGPMLGLLPRFHTGGGYPAQQMPMAHLGGNLPPMMQQDGNAGIVPPNVLTGGGLRPMGMNLPNVGTGGAQPPQPMPQNRLGGGGYNYGLGGLLR